MVTCFAKTSLAFDLCFEKEKIKTKKTTKEEEIEKSDLGPQT